jgi:putative ABC transport system substrate-binding protein
MRRREFIGLVCGAAGGWPFAARAQQRPASVGFLGGGDADPSMPLIEALKRGMRENGLIEGKDYVLELRWAGGHYERLPALARELADHGARVIIVSTVAAARAAQRENSVIPIVMAIINDPVGNGIITTLARPGGNTTGLATLNQDLTPKLLELLQTVLPKATTVAVLSNPTNPSNVLILDSVRVQAAPRGITVQDFEVNTPDELDAALRTIATQQPDALLIMPDAAILDLGVRIATLALQHRIPVISTRSEMTDAGGLISYGVSRRDSFRRSAYFVKKVLDGVKPADLPVEQPTRIVLSVNLKTAKALGLTIPPSLLVAADEVIE